MAWTSEQQRVIDSRNKNLLVSAAAGSGKTAVMVERIIQVISDENSPVDIDRLLVVTFTNAAASEMKERIMNALEKRIEENPGSAHLVRQMARIQKAQITTIHSFCLNLIREHFMEIDLDPGFRIGEEGEISLLEQEALAQVLEEAYEEKAEDFCLFLESYATGKSDKKIEEFILKAYTFARSGKNPRQWLCQAGEAFECQEGRVFEQKWAQYLLEDISYDVEEILTRYERLMEYAQSPGIPDGHRKSVLEEWGRVKLFGKEKSFANYIEAANNWKKTAIRGRGKKEHSKDEIKRLMDLRKETHEIIEKVIAKKLPPDEKTIIREMEWCRKPMRAFVTLVLRFMDVMEEKKREKNLVDFSDLEQYALAILTDGTSKEGISLPSKTAKEKKEFYQEIYVDEYQDTNEIQEEIIRLVSGEDIGKHNLFTVGDLKQSIYGFRQAKPELFIRRYYHYEKEAGEHELIELQNNFRSRKEVLNVTNYLFRNLMIQQLGGIAYDEKVSLFPAMEFPEGEKMDAATELLLLPLDEGELSMTDVAAEAAAIGYRIRGMIDGPNPQMVTCQNPDGTKGLRKAEYRDIVILLRTVSGWGEVFQEQLDRMGIPAFCESKKGSFTSIEVQTIMSVLKVLDNARQDIPFTSFLRAPFVGMTGEEMVWMMKEIGGNEEEKRAVADYFYEYLEHGSDEAILKKLKRAQRWLEEFRRKKTYLTIQDLIWEILMETGYYHYIGAMPAGERRQANMRMLMEKARAYESGSYKGLFCFVRYMEQLKEYDIDYGEANIQGEHENLVRIMSIHKSKGLEYPIVFLGGLSKKFNMMDARNTILMHSEYYFGPDVVRLDTREKRSSPQKKMIAAKMQEEMLGEELRILYVAMTRAKDKLVMTGITRKLADRLKNCLRENRQGPCSYYQIKNASCYMDWILMALIAHPAMEKVIKSYYPNEKYVLKQADQEELKVKILSPEYLIEEELMAYGKAAQQKALLYEAIVHKADREKVQSVKEELSWRYAYEKEAGAKIKYSVSEIKQQSQLVSQEEYQTPAVEEKEPLVPDFLKEEKKVTPTSRGTAVHKCMELLDFTRDYTKESLDEEIKGWIQEGKIEERYYRAIPQRQILWFLRSRIGKRASHAAKRNQIFKERQFVMGLPLKEMETELESGELAVIQGIMDLYFVEDGELVLVDYKTDRVKRGQESILTEHYKSQMETYRKALEQMTGQRVKEVYLSSFTLNKNILLLPE